MFTILLLGLLVVAGAQPINLSTASTSSISACSAAMDDQLPYYTPEGFNFSGNIRRYYVAAEIDTWNYGKEP